MLASPSLTTLAGKGGNVMAALRLAHMAYKVAMAAAQHGRMVAAGGTSILEVQRRMTCGAYVQVGAGAWDAEGSVDSPGMLLLRSYGCLFLVLIWLVRNSLGGGGLPGRC